MSQSSKRQCWECQRRRLVCDSTSPVCNQCRTRRITCPGYEDTKPLVWLAPGRVTSKTRRPRKDAAASGAKASVPGKQAADGERAPRPTAATLTQAGPQNRVKVPRLILKTERCDIYNAAHYYNEAIYPDLVATELAPSWFVLPSLHLYIEVLPPAVCHILIAMAFSHFILHRPNPLERTSNDKNITALHEHRVLAIRALNVDISDETKRKSDITIKAVLMFLMQELQQSTLPNWREHLQGLLALIDLRGGLLEYIRTTKDTLVVMVSFFILIVISNTTSPADQQTMLKEHVDYIDTITELYSKAMYPNCPCPTEIFTCIIRINYLRHQATQLGSDAFPPLSTLQATADQLLQVALSFRAEDRVQPDVAYLEEWLLVGRAFQSSAVLYLIRTLRGIFPVDRQRELDLRFAHHRDILGRLLGEATRCPRARRGMFWPLIVAGACAEAGDEEVRRSIAEELEAMSKQQGVASHLQAKMVLQRFWDSGRREWDECFDQPYALIV